MIVALTLNEFLRKQGLNKKEFGLLLGYPKTTASQNVNKMTSFIFVEREEGWDVYSKREVRSFVLPEAAQAK